MDITKEVILSEVSIVRKILELTYKCDICYENPRLKRKYKDHYHGGGCNTNSTFFKTINWNGSIRLFKSIG
jgi:hypothetical protein